MHGENLSAQEIWTGGCYMWCFVVCGIPWVYYQTLSFTYSWESVSLILRCNTVWHRKGRGFFDQTERFWGFIYKLVSRNSSCVPFWYLCINNYSFPLRIGSQLPTLLLWIILQLFIGDLTSLRVNYIGDAEKVQWTHVAIVMMFYHSETDTSTEHDTYFPTNNSV